MPPSNTKKLKKSSKKTAKLSLPAGVTPELLEKLAADSDSPTSPTLEQPVAEVEPVKNPVVTIPDPFASPAETQSAEPVQTTSATAGENLAEKPAEVPAEVPVKLPRASRKTSRLELPPGVPLHLFNPSKPPEEQQQVELSSPAAIKNPTLPLPAPEPIPQPATVSQPLPAPATAKTSIPTPKPAPKVSTGDLPSGDNNIIDDFNDTLADECFTEGNRRLAAKDREGAIEQYREALAYAPTHTEISLKLAEVLAMEKTTLVEAEMILAKALDLAPKNKTLQKKIKEIRKQIERTDLPGDDDSSIRSKSGSFKTVIDADGNTSSSEISIIPVEEAAPVEAGPAKGTCPSCGLVNAPKESICRRCYTPLKGKARFYSRAAQSLASLPNRISTINLIVLIIVGLAVIVSFGVSRKQSRIEITAVLPLSQGSVSFSSPSFQWQSTAEDVHYLLQIEKDGVKVIERYTQDRFYVLSPEELQKVKSGVFYKWRVIPISPKRIKLDYATQELDVRFIEAPKPKVAQQQQQQTPSTQQSQTPSQIPSPIPSQTPSQIKEPQQVSQPVAQQPEPEKSTQSDQQKQEKENAAVPSKEKGQQLNEE